MNIFQTLGFPDSSVGKESVCNAGDPQFDFWVRKIPWRRERLPTPVFLGFPCGWASKESACNSGDLGSIPGLGRSPGEGEGYPTSVFWSGEFHGLYSLWGRKEWDMTDFYFQTPSLKILPEESLISILGLLGCCNSMDAAFLNLLFRGKLFIATLKGNPVLSIIEETNAVKQNNNPPSHMLLCALPLKRTLS